MWIVERFVDDLFRYLTNNADNKHCSAIIKRHNDKFEQFGEFSFPWKVTAWRKFITWSSEWDNSTDISIFNVTYCDSVTISIDDACARIKDKSKELPLLINKCKHIKDRIHIFLDRTFLIKISFTNVGVDLEPCKVDRGKKLYFTIEEGIENDINHYRLKLISKAAINLVTNQGYRTAENFAEDTIKIFFTSRSSHTLKDSLNVVSAPVLNMKNGLKEKQTSTAEYLERRTLDMKLKAQHKYRIHVTDENLWSKSVKQLGEACAVFDLLQIKPSHSARISMADGGTGCSKGASFVLYNYARLTRIIDTFHNNVSNKLYPELPDVADVDFASLDDEDEWFIIFNYVLSYNSTLQNCVEFRADEFRVSPHHLCSFLSSLVVKFSVYYRKVKVLLTPREHLIPKVFARIHLLMLLHKILSHGLALLSIEPLSEM